MRALGTLVGRSLSGQDGPTPFLPDHVFLAVSRKAMNKDNTVEEKLFSKRLHGRLCEDGK